MVRSWPNTAAQDVIMPKAFRQGRVRREEWEMARVEEGKDHVNQVNGKRR